MAEIGQGARPNGDMRRDVALHPPPIRLREGKLEVLDERVCDEEFGECCIDGGHRGPATKMQRGEVGEVENEELDKGLASCSVAGGHGDADVGQRFARCMDGRKNVQWGVECI